MHAVYKKVIHFFFKWGGLLGTDEVPHAMKDFIKCSSIQVVHWWGSATNLK